MYKFFVLLIAVSFTLSCSNNQPATTTETKTDSTVNKDSASRNNESNTVTPPASNGQY